MVAETLPVQSGSCRVRGLPRPAAFAHKDLFCDRCSPLVAVIFLSEDETRAFIERSGGFQAFKCPKPCLEEALIVDEVQRLIEQPSAEAAAAAIGGNDEPAEMGAIIAEIFAIDRDAAEKTTITVSMPNVVDRAIQALDEFGQFGGDLAFEGAAEAREPAIGLGMLVDDLANEAGTVALDNRGGCHRRSTGMRLVTHVCHLSDFAGEEHKGHRRRHDAAGLDKR